MTRIVVPRIEWLMVAVQAVVLAVVLGLPNISGTLNVFTSGYLTGQNGVALITTLLWLGTVVLIAVVGLRAARSSLRSTSRGSLPVVVAVVVGLSCLTAGAVRHQAASFHPCCGSVERAHTALEGNQ